MVLTWIWNFLSQLGRKKNPLKVREIVCIKLDEIGDMITCVCVFAALKQEFPNAKIRVVCKPFVKTIIESDPNVYSVHTDVYWTKFRPDIWLELRGNAKTLFYSVYKFPKVRVDRGSVRFKRRGNQEHETITNINIVNLLAPIYGFQPLLNFNTELASSDYDKRRAEELLQSWRIEKFAFIHPGARAVLRRWAPARFAEVVNYLYQKYQLKSVIMVTSSELGIAKTIQELVPESELVIWNSTDSLLTAYEVIKKSSIFIGNESGPLQLADAAKVPLVGLFGPGVKHVFYPQNKNAIVIHEILECNPCDQLNCKFPEFTCMDRITVDKVNLSIDKLLN